MCSNKGRCKSNAKEVIKSLQRGLMGRWEKIFSNNLSGRGNQGQRMCMDKEGKSCKLCSELQKNQYCRYIKKSRSSRKKDGKSKQGSDYGGF